MKVILMVALVPTVSVGITWFITHKLKKRKLKKLRAQRPKLRVLCADFDGDDVPELTLWQQFKSDWWRMKLKLSVRINSLLGRDE